MAVKRKPAKRRSSTPVRRRRTATPVKRRRRSTAKKGFLSEMFNPKMTSGSFKAMASGAVGGASAGIITKMMTNQTPLTQNLILGGISFVTAAALKMPNVAAGISGVTVYRMMENAGMLAEGDMTDFEYADPLDSMPVVLNESPEMFLQENDNMYLQEDDDMFLQQEYNVGYYGSGFDGSGYV